MSISIFLSFPHRLDVVDCLSLGGLKCDNLYDGIMTEGFKIKYRL